jgi:hypothetical protein
MLPKRKDQKSFPPIVKFNALNGKVTRPDRVQDKDGNWKTQVHEIPIDDFEFVADIPHLEIGWIDFGATAKRRTFG